MSIRSEIARIENAKSDIAEAIADKGVTVPSDTTLDGMAALISDIETGSDPVLQTKTVTPTTSKQTITADSGYDGLDTVTVNAMPTATQATPTVSIDSAGKITATATQTAGYVTAGTKTGTKQLTTQAAKTITPSTSSQTAVAKNVYTTGAVTVAGDANLVAGNIKSGTSIFGVTGSYEGSGGGGGSVETCEVAVSGFGNSSYYPTNIAYTSVDSSGKVIGVNQAVSTSSVTVTCIKGSTLAVKFKSSLTITAGYTNASLLFFTSPTAVFKLDDNATTAIITNASQSSGGGND